MVIQCPECLTKFSVRENSANLKSPNAKFHCSRCDAVFSLSKASSPSSANTKSFLQDNSCNAEIKDQRINDQSQHSPKNFTANFTENFAENFTNYSANSSAEKSFSQNTNSEKYSSEKYSTDKSTSNNFLNTNECEEDHRVINNSIPNYSNADYSNSDYSIQHNSQFEHSEFDLPNYQVEAGMQNSVDDRSYNASYSSGQYNGHSDNSAAVEKLQDKPRKKSAKNRFSFENSLFEENESETAIQDAPVKKKSFVLNNSTSTSSSSLENFENSGFNQSPNTYSSAKSASTKYSSTKAPTNLNGANLNGSNSHNSNSHHTNSQRPGAKVAHSRFTNEIDKFYQKARQMTLLEDMQQDSGVVKCTEAAINSASRDSQNIDHEYQGIVSNSKFNNRAALWSSSEDLSEYHADFREMEEADGIERWTNHRIAPTRFFKNTHSVEENGSFDHANINRSVKDNFDDQRSSSSYIKDRERNEHFSATQNISSFEMGFGSSDQKFISEESELQNQDFNVSDEGFDLGQKNVVNFENAAIDSQSRKYGSKSFLTDVDLAEQLIDFADHSDLDNDFTSNQSFNGASLSGKGFSENGFSIKGASLKDSSNGLSNERGLKFSKSSFNSSIDKYSKQDLAKSSRALAEGLTAKFSGYTASPSSFLSSSFFGAILLLSVPFLTGAGFYKISRDLQFSHDRGVELEGVASLFDHSGVTTLEQAASPDVRITDSRAKIVLLRSGEEVIQISGKLNNESIRSLKEIKVKVKAYDINNKEVGTSVFKLKNALSKIDDISVYSASDLLDFMNQTIAKNEIFNPRERYEFFGVMKIDTNSDALLPAYFNTQVFSVTPIED